MKSNSNAILIISCDKYSDLWDGFFFFFWKNWHNCPYKIYLGSNTLSYTKDKRIHTILSGKDIDWSTSLKKILSQIPEKNILIWPDDAFIVSPVQNKQVKKCIDFLIKKKAKNIHCRPPPAGDSITHTSFIGKIQKGTPYRVNLEGLWNKEYLQKVLIEGESPWNFEIMGSYRTSYEDGFYSVHKPLFDFLHLVEKGRFIRDHVNYCQKQGIRFDLKKRKMLSLVYNFYSSLIRSYVDFIFSIDWRIRLKIMNILRKLLVSY